MQRETTPKERDCFSLGSDWHRGKNSMKKGENFQVSSSTPPLCAPSHEPNPRGDGRGFPALAGHSRGCPGRVGPGLFPPGDPRMGEPLWGWASSVCVTQGWGHSKFCWGWGKERKHQENKTRSTPRGSGHSRGCGGQGCFTQHAQCDRKFPIFHRAYGAPVHGDMLGLFQSQGMVPDPSSSSWREPELPCCPGQIQQLRAIPKSTA